MRLGSKKIYLPNFTIALARTPHLPPNFAQFIVPLTINKLDLRDYLLNAYNVEVLSVRSYIQQQKVARNKNNSEEERLEWYRPRAIKKMTVELAKPFVYPEAPEDLEPWNRSFWEHRGKLEEERAAMRVAYPRQLPSKDRPRLRKLAEESLREKKENEMETGVVEVEKELSVR